MTRASMCHVALTLVLTVPATAALSPLQAAAQGVLPTAQGPIPVSDSAGHPFDSTLYQLQPVDLSQHAYVEQEFFYSGVANVYQYESLADQANSQVQVVASGPYTNRMLVRRPADPARFSGNVVVEILNDTALYDAPEVWAEANAQFLRAGDIWVGITGKPVAIAALQEFNPQRYAALSWANPANGQNAQTCPSLPSDSSFATENGLLWDIFTQAGALLKSDAADNPLQGFPVKALIGTGYSQSAANLFTYINAITPTLATPVFDGFLVASGGGQYALNQCTTAPARTDPRNVLHSATAAIIQTQSQTDFANARAAYRADSDATNDRYRLYEIPGASHVNAFQVLGTPGAGDTLAAGGTAGTWDEVILTCQAEGPLNDYPQHYVLNNAFQRLEAWVRFGVLPAHAPPITSTGAYPNVAPVLDAYGNAEGGLRTPLLDVPAAIYTAVSPGPGYCRLYGYQVAFPPQRLQALYSSHELYVAQFADAAVQDVLRGWLAVPDAVTAIKGASSASVP